MSQNLARPPLIPGTESSTRMRMEVVVQKRPQSATAPLSTLGHSTPGSTDAKPSECKGRAVPRKRKAVNTAKSSFKKGTPPPKRKIRKLRHYSDDEPCSGDDLDSDSDHVLESRLRTRGKLSTKDIALQKLLAKRKGVSPPNSEPVEEASGEPGSESERDSLFDGSSSDSEEDFIVDDGGGRVAQLPKEFSMEAHEEFPQQFKKIFQLMVHIAVRPLDERKKFMQNLLKTEDYFSVPLDAARRRMSGLKSSMVTSSRWSPEFIALLDKYPELEIRDLPATATATIMCDICRIQGRRACRCGKLGGFPYLRMGFADEDKVDHKKRKKEKREYNLGRFCSERVAVYHQMSHWEYDLFKCVLREVDQLHEAAQGSKIANDRDVFVSVKYWNGKKPPKDLHDADGINDWLVTRNLVAMEWEKIKKLIEKAENLENATKRGRTD